MNNLNNGYIILTNGKKIVFNDNMDSEKISQYINDYNYIDKITECVLPEGVTEIIRSTFFCAINLKKIYIPNSVEIISDGAFCGCTSLEYIELPSNLKIIGRDTFRECTNLNKISIPDSVTIIDSCAFINCYNLKEIKLSKNINVIKAGMFMGCTSLENINIPKKVYKIDDYAFSKSGIEYININNIKNIGKYAFSNCKNLKNVIIDNKLESLCMGVFEGCINLKKVKLPNSVKNIYKDSFKGCFNLETINIPENCDVDSNAFFWIDN